MLRWTSITRSAFCAIVSVPSSRRQVLYSNIVRHKVYNVRATRTLPRGEVEVIETDVLVVGMGPTGAMLSCDLSLAGVGVTVIDKLTDFPAHSKEGGVPGRVAEILEQRELLAIVED